MSAERLRSAAALMRSRANPAARVAIVEGWWGSSVLVDAFAAYAGEDAPATAIPGAREDATHIASWHPAVALAVAKAMDDVAQAWEICDDGWTRDMDDDPIRFEDTVDGGWLAVANAYLGAES